MSRTLLHVATDWPGHAPRVAETIWAHAETPLHWAASSDDVEAGDALRDLGADLPWEPLTPLDAAERGAAEECSAGADALVRWLREQGARRHTEPTGG